MPKFPKSLWKKVNIETGNLYIFWTTAPEISRENVVDDNIKSHKKAGFFPLSRKDISRKTAGRGQIEPANWSQKTKFIKKKTGIIDWSNPGR